MAGGLWRPFVGTGFCGALTTFSTFQVQFVELGDDGHGALAAALSRRERRLRPRAAALGGAGSRGAR